MPAERASWALLGLFAACTDSSPSPAAPPARHTSSVATTPSADPWAPSPSVVRPEEWTLVVAAHRGPCSARDPVPCHVTWSARADGSIEKTEQPNGGGDAIKTTLTLSPAERDELRALVRSPEFGDGMRTGFPCQGPGRDRDTTVTLDFGHPGGDLTPPRNVELCLRDANAVDVAPVKVVRLVRK